MGPFQFGVRLVKSPVWFLVKRYLYKWIPHGFNLFIDLKNKLPGLSMETIFDVGANVGQSARKYMRHFPSARIFCFEPVRSTFAILQDNMAGVSNVQIHQIALGAKRERVRIRLQESSLVNSLLERVDAEVIADACIEEIEVDTLDDFCARHKITGIDFLKIDTEGFDLNVLLGAQGLLDGKCVSFVQVEAGISPKNEVHVPFGVLKEHLESKGFFLFGVYNQTPEWSGEPLMSFCNAVFISSHVIEAYCAKHGVEANSLS